MYTLKEIYEHLKKELRDVYPQTYDQDARYILERRAGFDWGDIVAHPDTDISQEIQNLIYGDLKQYINNEPLSRIYGVRQFWRLDFKVTEDTLDPRPDTETLVRAVRDRYLDNPPERILDLGTGTGCILIALLTEFKNARGVAVDKSEAALHVARENADKHGVGRRIDFICADWCAPFSNLNDSMNFDVIVSNPPYIHPVDIESLSPAVKNFDPILALTDHQNGLEAYKIIFSALKNVLKNDGRAFFEIGINQAYDIERIAEKALSRVVDIYPDIAGIPRVVEISMDKTNGDN